MGADDGVVAGQRHVQEVLPLQEAGEGAGQRLVVVVPAEAELWRCGGHDRRVRLARRRGQAGGVLLSRRSHGAARMDTLHGC